MNVVLAPLRRVLVVTSLAALLLSSVLGCTEKRAQPLMVRAEDVASAEGPSPVPVAVPPNLSVRQVMVGRVDFATFLQLLDDAELVETFDKAAGPLTVFAPDVRALRRADVELLGSLRHPSQRPRLRRLLLAHVVPGERLSVAELAERAVQGGAQSRLRTAAGTTLRLSLSRGTVRVIQRRSARIVSADLQARNGVVHRIDRLMIDTVAPRQPVVTEAPRRVIPHNDEGNNNEDDDDEKPVLPPPPAPAQPSSAAPRTPAEARHQQQRRRTRTHAHCGWRLRRSWPTPPVDLLLVSRDAERVMRTMTCMPRI